MERHKLSGLSFLTSIWPLNDNKPTLFLIHAAGSTALSWTFQIESLGNTANVIAVDLPGHGESNGSGCNNIVDYTKIVVNLIDKININKCIPAGISMGGAVVLQMLVDYADRFYAGILINTGAKMGVLPDIFEAIKSDTRAFMANLINFVLPADLDAERFNPIMEDVLKTKKKIVLDDFSACNAFDIRSRLNEINLPVLIISSEKDSMTPAWYAEYLKKNIKRANLSTIKGAGHMVIIENPEFVIRTIKEFIDKIN